MYACLVLCLFVMMCLCSFQGALAEECNRNFSRLGVGSVLSVAQKSDLLPFSYLQLPICLSLSYRSNIVNFSSSASHSTLRPSDWHSRGVKQC